MQWKNEIQLHTEGLSVLVWHGASRETDAAELEKFDVVRMLSTIWLSFHSQDAVGSYHVCCSGELLSQATKRFQKERQDCEGKISCPPN